MDLYTCPTHDCCGCGSHRCEDQVNKLLTIIDVLTDACLDHSCNLEGWDEKCPECRAAKAIHDHHAARKNRQ